jgi:hypothetical protein
MVRQLVSYLGGVLPSIQVRSHFPDPNEKLTFPSIVVRGVGAPRFLADVAGANVSEVGTVENNRAGVEYQVGNYEWTLKVDFWTANKSDREALYEKLFEVLNPEIDPMGLTLTLDEYFGQKCHYALENYSHGDSQESSQRLEWRGMLDLVATCRAIRKRNEFIVTQVEVQVETPDNIEVEE